MECRTKIRMSSEAGGGGLGWSRLVEGRTQKSEWDMAEVGSLKSEVNEDGYCLSWLVECVV